MTLDQLNKLPADLALSEFLRCCGCRKWAHDMTARRPFRSTESLDNAADDVWNTLSADEWREAFAHHPKIGDLEGLKERFAGTARWAAGEQAGVAAATDDLLQKLAEGNRSYEGKFGYIFIVCATGKSAGEMLALIHERLENEPGAEIHVAASEQAKITKVRLKKLFR